MPLNTYVGRDEFRRIVLDISGETTMERNAAISSFAAHLRRFREADTQRVPVRVAERIVLTNEEALRLADALAEHANDPAYQKECPL